MPQLWGQNHSGYSSVSISKITECSFKKKNASFVYLLIYLFLQCPLAQGLESARQVLYPELYPQETSLLKHNFKISLL
jgi:hypothetical protein